MIQAIIVGIIGVAVAVYVIYRIYTFFFDKSGRARDCGCGNCHCGTSKKSK